MKSFFASSLLFVFICSLTLLNTPAFCQYEGLGTYFEGLGSPYGGCGVPQEDLETTHFVALNVFDTPNDYSDYPKPLVGGDMSRAGAFEGGLNCGRWVKVIIGEDCNGTNDGAQNAEFCRGNGAQWVDDSYSGAELYMIIADACPDANAWCRDNFYHLDMSEHSMNQFEKNGTTVNDLIPGNWNNRKLYWEYVHAPDYTGDINIYFIQGAQQWWPAIMINHLENGIHSVEQKVGNTWLEAERNSDLGQSFILPNTDTPYTIRIYDADDQLINNGREYTFTRPSSCGSACSAATTLASYTTMDPIGVGMYNTISSAPFSFDQTTSTFHFGTDLLELEVLDMQGKEIFSILPKGLSSLECPSLHQGIYIVKTLSENGRPSIQKLVFSEN